MVTVQIERGNDDHTAQFEKRYLFQPLHITEGKKHIHCDSCRSDFQKSGVTDHVTGVDHCALVYKSLYGVNAMNALIQIVKEFRVAHSMDDPEIFASFFYKGGVSDEELARRIDMVLVLVSRGMPFSNVEVFDDFSRRWTTMPLLGESRSALDQVIPGCTLKRLLPD